ncbi:sulfur reduction protein DsrE [bacterium]|nr:MAG: sulfur reduction protein DsrE [bacterium]
MKLGFIVRTGPYTTQDIDTVYELSKAAIGAGHEVEIFLYDDAVMALNKDIKPPKERSIPGRLTEIIDMGATVSGAALSAKFRGLRRDGLIENTRIGGMATLNNLVESCDRIVTLSF